MTRGFFVVSGNDIETHADGTIRSKDKKELGTYYIKYAPSKSKYLLCELVDYCIITDEEYKEYKQLKKQHG